MVLATTQNFGLHNFFSQKLAQIQHTATFRPPKKNNTLNARKVEILARQDDTLTDEAEILSIS